MKLPRGVVALGLVSLTMDLSSEIVGSFPGIMVDFLNQGMNRLVDFSFFIKLIDLLIHYKPSVSDILCSKGVTSDHLTSLKAGPFSWLAKTETLVL